MRVSSTTTTTLILLLCHGEWFQVVYALENQRTLPLQKAATPATTPLAQTPPPHSLNAFQRAALQQQQDKPVFTAATATATINLVLFALRHDPSVPWYARVPRLVWELALLVVAQAASSHIATPLYLLLGTMALSTGLVDVLVWAPIYAHLVSFETCNWGNQCTLDPWKGVSRMAVSIQAVVGGLLYLWTALQAWEALGRVKDEQAIHRHHRIQSEWRAMEQQQQQQQQLQQQQLQSFNSDYPQ